LDKPKKRSDNGSADHGIASGTQIGRYTVVKPAELAGLGEVYEARDTDLDRLVLLKFLPQAYASIEAARARFSRTAQQTAAVASPAVLAVFDIVDFEGRTFAVLEKATGRSLAEMVAGGQLSVDLIIDLAVKIGCSLEETHSSGLIHGAVNPRSIIVDDRNRVRLVDFGMVAINGDAKSVQVAGEFKVTAYLSPEQVRRGRAEKHSDIFSFGAVLYQIVTDRVAFLRTDPEATLRAITDEAPHDMLELRSDLPPAMNKVIMRALEKVPEKRYAGIRDMLSDLERIQQEREDLRHETRYRSLNDDVLDSSWVGIIITNADAEVVWANRALERYLDVRREKIVEQDMMHLVRDKIAHIVKKCWPHTMIILMRNIFSATCCLWASVRSAGWNIGVTRFDPVLTLGDALNTMPILPTADRQR